MISENEQTTLPFAERACVAHMLHPFEWAVAAERITDGTGAVGVSFTAQTRPLIGAKTVSLEHGLVCLT